MTDLPSDIPFVRALDFDYAQTERVMPALRRVVARNPSQFTLYGTNTFIVGEGEVAIVDPGPAIEEHIDAVMAAINGETVSHVFVTHTHRDHSPAADIFKRETGAETCGFGPHPTGRFCDGGGAPVEDGPDLTFAPDRRLADGERIEGAGWTIEAVHTPGHMSNHMCYAWAEADRLFSGDHVMAWATSVISPPDGCLASYLNSLRKVQGRPEEVFLPSHGPAIENPMTVVAAHLQHRHARTRQIVEQLQAGPAAIPELVATIYPGLSENLIEAASLSVLAHLLDLRGKGQAACTGCEWTDAWTLSG